MSDTRRRLPRGSHHTRRKCSHRGFYETFYYKARNPVDIDAIGTLLWALGCQFETVSGKSRTVAFFSKKMRK